MAKRRRRRWLRWLLAGLGLVLLGGIITGLALHRSLPEGERGPQADALARELESAARADAWGRTQAVRWTFAGSHHFLWDRARGLVRVRWDGCKVLLRLDDRSGRTWRDDNELSGEARRELLDEAYGYWVNDSFWLNPLVKLFDPGVVRRRVRLEDGSEALLVTYTKGGQTPGDSYLWIAGDDGLPRAWRMWVSIIPIGGLEVTWERWKTLSTGARVSTLHQWGPLELELTDVRGATDLQALEAGPDPFSRLMDEGP